MRGIRLLRALALPALIAVAVPLLGACAPSSPSPTVTVATAPAAAQPAAAAGPVDLSGRWEGTLKIAGQEIGMTVKFQGAGSDLKALLDVPAQGAMDIPLSKLSYDHPKVHFEAFAGPRLATYDGEVKADGSIAGEFRQANFKGVLNLNRVAAQPTAPLPYRQEEVTFKNGDITLAGTLTLPPAGGPFPAVVLITGSGAQNRDEDLLGFPIFRVIADHLTRNGIAVLRYDDRGVGGSAGNLEDATTADLAGDVLAGVNLLKARPDINGKQVGLIGHSEGGIVAPIAADRSQDVAFIVLLAGTGVPGRQVLLQQLADIQRANGKSQTEIDQSVALETRIIDAVLTGQGLDQVKADMRPQVKAQIQALPEEQRQALGDLDKAVEDAINGQIQAVSTPWFKYFLAYDPAPALENVHVPVLALFGGKDLQVSASANEPAVKAALAKGGNQQVTTKVFPQANHLFQQANTGSPQEYGTLKKEFVPELLPYIVDWIKQTTR